MSVAHAREGSRARGSPLRQGHIEVLTDFILESVFGTRSPMEFGSTLEGLAPRLMRDAESYHPLSPQERFLAPRLLGTLAPQSSRNLCLLTPRPNALSHSAPCRDVDVAARRVGVENVCPQVSQNSVAVIIHAGGTMMCLWVASRSPRSLSCIPDRRTSGSIRRLQHTWGPPVCSGSR